MTSYRLRLFASLALAAFALAIVAQAVPSPSISGYFSSGLLGSSGAPKSPRTPGVSSPDEPTPDPDFAKRGGLVRRGVWGGEHIGLTVRSKDAKLEYDCAHGTIDQPLRTDSRGRFNARGTHTWESGGPEIGGRKPDTHPARYSGNVRGGRMVITVTLNDSNKVVGTFTLTYGDGPNIFKCK